MIENSTSGLTLLASDNDVVVTREELHQPALQRYAPRPDGRSRHVAVELHIAPISHGRHAGEPGIEVRLDGRPVGELTALMARRYGALVADARARGQRPAAEARVSNGPRGIQVTVSLPDAPAGAPVPPAPLPPTGPRPRRRATKPLLIGAGVVVGLLVISGILGGRGAPAPTTPTAATAGATPAALAPQAAATPAATPTTTAPPAVAAPPVVTDPALVAAAPAAPAPRSTTAPKPAPPAAQPPAAQPPAAQPPAAPPPAAQPPAPKPPVAAAPAAPAGGCNSNYSGCVPIASDVDCQGGSGNGPAYVKGPVRVTGTDVYGLDSDNDGIGCE